MGYKGLEEVKRDYIRLQRLQKVTRVYKGLQGVTKS